MKSKVPNRKYQICKRCVMDTSDPFIVFDNKGFCNHCNIFLTKKLPAINQKDENKLEYLKVISDIKASRKNSSKYDVLIGISGGVDSSYTLLKAHEEGLKIFSFAYG